MSGKLYYVLVQGSTVLRVRVSSNTITGFIKNNDNTNLKAGAVFYPLLLNERSLDIMGAPTTYISIPRLKLFMIKDVDLTLGYARELLKLAKTYQKYKMVRYINNI